MTSRFRRNLLELSLLVGFFIPTALGSATYNNNKNIEQKPEKNVVLPISLYSKLIDDYVLSIFSKAESNGNPNAVSDKGARGEFQIMPETWGYLVGRVDTAQMFDPERSREIAIRHLIDLERFYSKNFHGWNRLSNSGKIYMIAAGYNGGQTRFMKNEWDINRMPQETRDFAAKITRLYRRGGSR